MPYWFAAVTIFTFAKEPRLAATADEALLWSISVFRVVQDYTTRDVWLIRRLSAFLRAIGHEADKSAAGGQRRMQLSVGGRGGEAWARLDATRLEHTEAA